MKVSQSWRFVPVLLLLIPVYRSVAEPLSEGFGRISVGSGDAALTVFTYKPKDYSDGPLLVVFHGMQRNAEGYCASAAVVADRFKMLVAAPYFDAEHYSRQAYNLGAVMKKGVAQPSSQWTYQRVPEVIEAVRQREGRVALPYYFVGHSAGAQFLMRYTALMPAGALRIVAANPGSDLFPRRDWPFGYGFGDLPNDLSDDAALQRYLAAPLTLYLGLDDVDPHHFELDRSAAAEREGRFRLERGRACFEFARDLAQQHQWKFNWRKVEVAGIAHEGKKMLGARELEQALFPDAPAKGNTGAATQSAGTGGR